MLIGVGILLPDNKLYKIRIRPDDLENPVVIKVEMFYTPYRNLGIKNIDTSIESMTVRKGDRITLRFNGSTGNGYTWTSSKPSVVSINNTSG